MVSILLQKYLMFPWQWLNFQDNFALWRSQTGYLGWVQARYWSNSRAGWQDTNHPQQGIYQCMFITSNKKRNLSSKQADMMTHQQLMRVYGALLWSLSKILGNPEVGGCHVLFVHTGRALAPITTRRKRYWLIVCFRSAVCTLEVFGASPSDMLPIENCLKLSRF